jgi:beta-phosphoglucomutase
VAALRAVIFDFDGVLVDSEPLHFACLRDALGPEGVAIDAEEYERVYLAYDDRTAIRVAFETHAIRFDRDREEATAQRKALLFQQRLPEIRFFPGARELVRQLAGALPLAIASGALRAEIEAILAAGGLRDAFTAVVGADDVERTKPDPMPFLAARDLLASSRAAGLASRECVAFEDSVGGVAAARAAGMSVVAVTNSVPAGKLGLAQRVVDSLERVSLADLHALAAEA